MSEELEEDYDWKKASPGKKAQTQTKDKEFKLKNEQ
jgi:hypothetical protein